MLLENDLALPSQRSSLLSEMSEQPESSEVEDHSIWRLEKRHCGRKSDDCCRTNARHVNPFLVIHSAVAQVLYHVPRWARPVIGMMVSEFLKLLIGPSYTSLGRLTLDVLMVIVGALGRRVA